MATITPKTNKKGEIISYRLRCCLGRDDQYKQIWRSCTIPRPEGLTPAKERKEVERLADAWEREQRAEYERTPSATDKSKITLSEFVEKHWWPDHIMDGTHKPYTIDFYDHSSKVVLSYFGQKKLRQIDAEAVKRFIKYLNTEAQTERGEPYSPTSVSHHYATLRNILRYALRFGYITVDPTQYLSQQEKPHRAKREIDFLTPEQARQFMRALDNEPLYWRTFFTLLLTCGLRRGEAVGLQWQDLDGEAMTLTVQRNITIDKGSEDGRHIGPPKTGVSRKVPITPRLYALLKELKHEHEANFQAVLLPTAYIFCSVDNAYISCYPTTPTRILQKIVKQNNLPNVSPHDLRHSAATLALEAGADVKQIQMLLGHSDPSTTLKFYASVTEERQRATVEGIEALIG